MSDLPPIVSVPCRLCSAPVDVLETFRVAMTMLPLCGECCEREEAKQVPVAIEMQRAASWQQVLANAPRYLKADASKLPNLPRSMEAMKWNGNGGRGMVLHGYPATGKTFTMILMLRQQHFAGKSVAFIGPLDFVANVQRKAFEAPVWASRLSRFDVLALDDADKWPMTKLHEQLLFGIIDSRIRAEKPTLYTFNEQSKALNLRFKLGEPLVNRIKHNCEDTHFPRLTTL